MYDGRRLCGGTSLISHFDGDRQFLKIPVYFRHIPSNVENVENIPEFSKMDGLRQNDGRQNDGRRVYDGHRVYDVFDVYD